MNPIGFSRTALLQGRRLPGHGALAPTTAPGPQGRRCYLLFTAPGQRTQRTLHPDAVYNAESRVVGPPGSFSMEEGSPVQHNAERMMRLIQV